MRDKIKTIKELQDYRTETRSKLNKVHQELTDMKLQSEILELEMKIREFTDEDYKHLVRLKTARKYKFQESTRLQDELLRIKEEFKEYADANVYKRQNLFVDYVQEFLPKEDWNMLWNKVNEKYPRTEEY